MVDAHQLFAGCMADEAEWKLHFLLFCYRVDLFSCLPN